MRNLSEILEELNLAERSVAVATAALTSAIWADDEAAEAKAEVEADEARERLDALLAERSGHPEWQTKVSKRANASHARRWLLGDYQRW